MCAVGCARGGPRSQPPPARADGSRVGFVRMDELVKKHPLYSQLARLDDDMEAIRLKSVGENIARSGADIVKEQVALQRELDEAAKRTQTALRGKQQEYERREQSAIAAALGAAGAAAGPGAAAIGRSVAVSERSQVQAASQAAGVNLNAYRGELIEQDRRAEQSLTASLNQRAGRTFRARADQLQRQESDFALQEASDDAAERLSIRTKLSNLALDDASRADLKKQLDALDRKEADGLAAVKNRDAATLADLQKQLREQTNAELLKQVAAMRRQMALKLGRRERDTRVDLVAQLGALPAGGGAALPATLSPDMRSKLEELHRKYQRDFDKDAGATVAEFQKTRADLMRRFQTLAGADAGAQAGAGQELSTLERQRGDLYNQMVAQIQSEVKLIAEKRGINVVFSDIVTPAAGGVDLTDDAARDIESLHE